MDLVATLAATWRSSCERVGPPRRRVLSLAGLPAVGKTTCLNYLRDRPIAARVIDEKHFLTREDVDRANDADKNLALTPGNSGVAEQNQIFSQAELRRCALTLQTTTPVDWVIVCGGVEITVLVLEMLAHRGLADITSIRELAYDRFADLRTSAAVVLLAEPAVLSDRIRRRIAGTGKPEDRSEFVNLVSEVYLPWLQMVVPRVIPVETSTLAPKEVGERVLGIVGDLTAK